MGEANAGRAARIVWPIVGIRCVIHLDTSFLIRALVHGSVEDGALRKWLRLGEPLAMSTIAWTEFLCGPVNTTHVELVANVVRARLPFSEEDAHTAAQLFNESGRRRGSLLDCMIAATAVRADAPIATSNPADFRRLEDFGLNLANV
ncbi:MAG: type II toxin-antitoxin system VapC family toxin [Gammaproteobacteria bacterium]|nr:type II toxin-antitoxin system VapC family toxin [Gammaproteobacteria bacterium]